MPLPEVADHGLWVLQRKIQYRSNDQSIFERGDIWATSWTVDPGGTVLVDEKVAIEIVQFDLVIQGKRRWPLFRHPKLFDELEIWIVFLSLILDREVVRR